MTARAVWGLRGPVKTCHQERKLFVRNCGADACETEERTFTETIELRANGELSLSSIVNPDGSVWLSRYEYSPDGRLLGIQHEYNGQPSSGLIYEYDPAGRLARTREGSGRVSETWQYDADGAKKKVLHIDVASQNPDTLYSWSVEGTNSGFSAPGATAMITRYDPAGRLVELRFTGPEDTTLSCVDFRYYTAGNLTEEIEHPPALALPPEIAAQMSEEQMLLVGNLFGQNAPRKKLHRYDTLGRRIETTSEFGPMGWDRTTSEYNEFGDLDLQISIHETKECEIREDLKVEETKIHSHRGEARFRYQYDTHGNWVEKQVENRNGAEDYTLSSIERRTLTYFN